MPAFDEILELEDTIKRLETELLKHQNLLKVRKGQLIRAKSSLRRAQDSIEELNANIDFLKGEAEVVIMAEYLGALEALELNKELSAGEHEKIFEFTKEIEFREKAIPVMEGYLKVAQKKLGSYQRLLPFKVPDDIK